MLAQTLHGQSLLMAYSDAFLVAGLCMLLCAAGSFALRNLNDRK